MPPISLPVIALGRGNLLSWDQWAFVWESIADGEEYGKKIGTIYNKSKHSIEREAITKTLK
jgi:hypothetical protein